jgi:uncharacterized delta-60 repeat protein
MRAFQRLFILLVLFCLVSKFSISQDGKIDSSFGVNGKATFAFSNSSASFAQATAIQKDGKIVIVGYYNYSLSTNFCVKRLLSNGAPDFTFGDSGLVVTHFSTGRGSYAISVEIQNDGKLLVGGSAFRDDNDLSFALVRYNTNGSLDTSFGNNGQILTFVNYGRNEGILDLVVLNDNRIIAVGGFDLFGPSAIIAYKSNGQVDSSFGNNGVSGLTGGATSTYAVKPSSDGGFITLRGSDDGGTQNMDFCVEKYKSTGRLDSTFGKNGRTSIDFYNNQDKPACLGILPDNSIIVVGRVSAVSGQFLTNWKTGIVKLKPNGIVDSSFGTNGRITHYLQSASTTYLSATAVNFQKDGKILITTQYDFKNYSISRLDLNGSLDSTFGTKGTLIVNIGLTTDSETFNNSALQTDNKLIVVGNNNKLANVYRISLFDEILPLRLISFYANHNGKTNLITWSTSEEINTDHFILEKSNNSMDFTTLGTIKALNNGKPKNDYSFTDQQPLKSINYYRLKMIDKDGKVSLSATRNVNNSNSFDATLYPNPVHQNLTLSFNTEKEMSVQVEIVNAEGKQVMKQYVQIPYGTSIKILNVAALSSGSYFVRITGQNIQSGLKFIKR